MNRQDAQDILGLGNSYSEADVKKAFRRLSKLCHPDVGGTIGLFREISEAQRTLTVRTGQQPFQPKQASGQTAQKLHWNPFRDTNYVCPWFDFMCIIQNGSRLLHHDGESFLVNRSMLDFYWLHTEAPVTVEIRLWKNRFTRLFCQPKEIVKKETAFKNNYAGSYQFDLKLNFAVTPQVTNWYEVRVEASWAKTPLFTKTGTCKGACASLPSDQHLSIGKICFDLRTKFTAETN